MKDVSKGFLIGGRLVIYFMVSTDGSISGRAHNKGREYDGSSRDP